jgi:hypothetical protein
MKKVRKFNKQQNDSIITKDISGDIHYIDSFSIEIENKKKYTIDYLTALLFTSIPNWVRILLKLRDFIVKPFGLETGIVPDSKNLNSSVHYNLGDRAIFFHVINRTPSEIVMAEDDKHLYFRTSLLVRKNSKSNIQSIYLTTLVQFHNMFGKIYFIPVKPFHKLIMKRLLINFSNEIVEKA